MIPDSFIPGGESCVGGGCASGGGGEEASAAKSPSCSSSGMRRGEQSRTGSLGGAPEGSQMLVCDVCRRSFEFTAGDRVFYESKGFSIPKKCKICKQQQQQQTKPCVNCKSTAHKSFECPTVVGNDCKGRGGKPKKK